MYKENTDFHLNGLPLEKAIAHFLEQKMHLGNEVKHNEFEPDKYPLSNRLIVDFWIAFKMLIECTNPKESTFMNDKIMLNKIDYFRRVDPLHLRLWVLIISFANFSKAIMQAIKDAGITLIELGIHADKYNFCNVVKQLFKSRLYGLVKSNLKFALVNANLKSKISKGYELAINKITNSADTVTTDTTVLTTTNDNNHLHQHQDEYRISELEQIKAANLEIIKRILGHG